MLSLILLFTNSDYPFCISNLSCIALYCIRVVHTLNTLLPFPYSLYGTSTIIQYQAYNKMYIIHLILADRISKIDLQLFLLIIIRFQLEENIAFFLDKKDYATTTQKIYTLDTSLPYSFIRKSTHWTKLARLLKINMINHCHLILYGLGVRVMVFDATFNNILILSWRSVVLVDDTGLPGE